VAERAHGRSPWRDAYELLIQGQLSRESRPRELGRATVTLKENAKGEVQIEVSATAIRSDDLPFALQPDDTAARQAGDEALAEYRRLAGELAQLLPKRPETPDVRV
jgi:hypothetical protein